MRRTTRSLRLRAAVLKEFNIQRPDWTPSALRLADEVVSARMTLREALEVVVELPARRDLLRLARAAACEAEHLRSQLAGTGCDVTCSRRVGHEDCAPFRKTVLEFDAIAGVLRQLARAR